MKTIFKLIFDDEKIEYFGIIPFSSCKIINQNLLDRSIVGWTPKSVVMMLIPYYSGEYEGRNISLYAVPKDYHLYFKEMYSRVIPKLKEAYPNANFISFADHSPIGETYAACLAGLGFIGDKFQLINEKYGSHVFIGEIITDIEFDKYDEFDIMFCEHCGQCSDKCPSSDVCFSEITQKKGELTLGEEKLIREQKCVWGCDVCRTVCPHNENIAITPIDFFKCDLTAVVDESMINEMSKEEFRSRAYGWKGKSAIIRNIRLLSR